MTDALLPLLERLTAASWECPFFQIKFDMSWVNWVMTANGREGLPEPLQSRCVVLDLPDLTIEQLHNFACSEGKRRGLPEPAFAAVLDVFYSGAIANARLKPTASARWQSSSGKRKQSAPQNRSAKGSGKSRMCRTAVVKLWLPLRSETAWRMDC